MREIYGITLGGIILLILSLGDIFSMTASYIALLIITTWYISVSKFVNVSGEEQ